MKASSQQPRRMSRNNRSRSRRRSRCYVRPSEQPRATERACNAVLAHSVSAPANFFIQLAHGSPTAVIPPPKSLNDVYDAVASRFDGVSTEDVLYCTVNTFKPDMDALLTSTLGLRDFIFIHIKGPRKEVTLAKSGALLGVTLTDNGHGKVFIKRIHPESSAARAQPAIRVGDHVEKVNGVSVLGQRHFTVAAMLRAIPVGDEFTLRLVEPLRASFAQGSPQGAIPNHLNTASDNTQTLRFRSTGTAVLQEAPSKTVVSRINEAFETYLGFNDDVLALTGWEIANGATNFVDLKQRFAESDLGGFGFPDELLFDIWGIVDDFRHNRLTTINNTAPGNPDNEGNSDEGCGGSSGGNE